MKALVLGATGGTGRLIVRFHTGESHSIKPQEGRSL
jgi:uncharacterized protein YbjT (DUF2867 family)